MSNASELLQLDLQLTQGKFHLQCQLNLPASGFTVICGRSGCGKTTLLRCIAGLTRAQGAVRFKNIDWQHEKKFLPAWQRPIAYVFQQPTLFPHLTVRDNLLFALKRVPPAERRISLDDAVNWLGLENLLDRKPNALSGGQQQRAAVARSLLANPALLLMDEPLASLDIDSKLEILPYLERLRSQLGIPVIYVTHAPDEMSRLADQLVLMEEGRVLAHGALNALLTNPNLPLTQHQEAAAVLDAVIEAHDAHYHLTQLRVGSAVLLVPLSPLPIGSHTRIRILARNVSIALDAPLHSSIQNCLQAKIVDIQIHQQEADALVRLAMDDAVLLSRITRRAVDQLQLQAGMTVYAQVKAIALIPH
ncbi:MAG: molybdenum ABC transporter ATP-binding protein [Pseudomonadales bacterium]